MSPTETTVFIVGEDTLLALVTNYVDGPTIFLRDGLLVASLTKKGVNGLYLSPTLFACDFGEIGGRLVTRGDTELDLNAMNANLQTDTGHRASTTYVHPPNTTALS